MIEQSAEPLLSWLKRLDDSATLEYVDWVKVLKIIDLEFFHGLNSNENVHKFITKWFLEKYPNKESEITELLNLDSQFIILASLLLVIAVQSNSNEVFIEKMQQLSIEHQISLKNTIQEIIKIFTRKNSTVKDEIRELRLDLDEANWKLQEKEEIIQKLTLQIADLGKYKAENQGFLEMKQEFEFLKEKYSKTELLLQKYKKKIEENSSVKVKDLEENLAQRNNEILKLKEELRKEGLLKKMIMTYKEQITKFETRNSALEVENSRLESQIMELSKELGSVKQSSQEQIKLLNDRIIEISNQRMDSSIEGPTLDQDQMVLEFENKISEARDEISRLSDKILVIENELDDMTRLKNAFEHDYRKTLELNSRIQLENKDLLSKLEKSADEVSLLQKLEISEKSILEQANLNSVQAQTIKGITQQLQLAQEESRLKHGQLNSLLQEKESLENKVNQFRERANAAEQLLAETRASLSAEESKNDSSDNVNGKLASATQKIVQLTDQNALLHQALRKAKNHILILDKAIKEEKSMKTSNSDQNPYSEAIHSFEIQLAEKNQEINRLKKDLSDLKESTLREEELMSAAWYNLSSSVQTSDLDKYAGDSSWLQLKKLDLM